MNDTFDSPRCRAVAAGELAKGLAQSVTRRGALKKFGAGIVAAVLASVGLAHKAQADPHFNCNCSAPPFWGCKSNKGGCFKFCVRICSGG
jgi:hypothetical protein